MKITNGTSDLYKVRNDIPIPVGLSHRSGNNKSAIMRSLKAGQSVLVPGSIRTNSRLAHEAIGKGKYTMRTMGNNCRVWRVA